MYNIDYETFEKKRVSLISILEKGLIDKAEFLSKSFELFEGKMYTEPDFIKSIEEGVFYYFYFNTLAKMYMKKTKSNKSNNNAYISNEYYRIKEEILLKLIKLFSDDEILAYYVHTNSVKLTKKLVEIYIPSKEKLIFHTINPKTISILKNKNLLSLGLKKSLIESYVNKKYY